MRDPVPAPAQRAAWLARAAELRREPAVRTVVPTALVEPVADPAAWQGWRMRPAGEAAALAQRALRRGDRVCWDLGEHLVGQPEFAFASSGNPVDSPLRVRLRLAELPAEAAQPEAPFASSLSHAWYQHETVTLDVLPCTYRLPRRLAGRWLALDVIDTSPAWSLRLDGVRFHAVTGAAGDLPPAPAGLPPRLAAIDRVALRTLRNCQQTVFEDGPKRDRRLWTGDLRLQLLADGVSFRSRALAERSLCLLAAFARERDGAFPACCYERPAPHAAETYITDYLLALPALLRELRRQGSDPAFIAGFAPLARHQIDLAFAWLGGDGAVVPPQGWWTFIDWQDGLDKRAALHGVLCWALDAWLGLAGELGLPTADDAALLARLRAAGRAAFLAEGRIASGGQRSWAGAAWSVLGGVVQGAEARAVLLATLDDPAAVRPGGPYLMHHAVHALWLVGERARATALIADYWGGMLDRGADVFWEVYDPREPLRSPYGDHRTNSACHAWSCTPAWFLRAPERAAAPS